MIDCVHLFTEIAPPEYDNADGSLAIAVCRLELSGTGFNPSIDCPVVDCPCKLHPGVKF